MASSCVFQYFWVKFKFWYPQHGFTTPYRTGLQAEIRATFTEQQKKDAADRAEAGLGHQSKFCKNCLVQLSLCICNWLLRNHMHWTLAVLPHHIFAFAHCQLYFGLLAAGNWVRYPTWWKAEHDQSKGAEFLPVGRPRAERWTPNSKLFKKVRRIVRRRKH